jgi:N6-adenosine-specific RNA methylase IME4
MAKHPIKVPPVKPIVIGCFTLTETAVEIKGRPSFGEFQGVLEFAHRAYKASGWWVADLLRYGAGREDWRDKFDQVVDATGYAPQTVHNLKYLGENVTSSRRRKDVPISLHFEVAKLKEAEQDHWLEKAARERLTLRELRLEIRASRRRRTLEGQAVLEGRYRVVYADPPWLYGDREPSGSGAQAHYPGMTVEALCALPVEPHCYPDAVLFLWTTAPMLYETPGPKDVILAWGFTPKTGMVWDKVDHNWGNYVSVRHEHLIIATRGSCTPDRPTPMIDSVQTERPGAEHSRKPALFRAAIERLYDGPYLELFASERVAGWTSFGNDARLWHQEAAPV